jgi:hypothetical protein
MAPMSIKGVIQVYYRYNTFCFDIGEALVVLLRSGWPQHLYESILLPKTLTWALMQQTAGSCQHIEGQFGYRNRGWA